MIRVSVVIPTYNREHLLGEALRSVLSQSVSPHEVIVVDDGSTDGTHDLVRGYGPPVTLLVQDHAGPAPALNAGLARAAGDWVAILASDDIWKQTKLERQCEYIQANAECQVVHTGYFHFGAEDRVMPPSEPFLWGDFQVKHLLMAEAWICGSSVMVRNDVGIVFPEWAPVSEDIVFYAELLLSGAPFGYIDEPLVGYRIHDGSLNHDTRQSLGATVQWQWVSETFAPESTEREPLLRDILTKALLRMKNAKRAGDWPTYWEWRSWLNDKWPAHLDKPRSLTERVFPRAYEPAVRLRRVTAGARRTLAASIRR